MFSGCSFWDWLAGKPITSPAPITDGGGGSPVAGDPADPAPDDRGAGDDPANDDPDQVSDGDDADSGDGAEGADGADGEQAAANGVCRFVGGTEPTPGPFEQVRIEPVDQSGEDPSFAAFREQLLQIVAQRDVDGLREVLDPNIKIGFGGNDGIENFLAGWGLSGDDASVSPIWTILSDAFALGGVFLDAERTDFVAPYLFALYNTPLDPFEHAVVTGQGVNVRAEPSSEARILDQVTHEVVRLIEPDEELPKIELSGREYCWVRVQLASGEVGYMADKFLWSPVGYRIGFTKSEHGWLMNFFVAGD